LFAREKEYIKGIHNLDLLITTIQNIKRMDICIYIISLVNNVSKGEKNEEKKEEN
jgi:hypothetical protein